MEKELVENVALGGTFKFSSCVYCYERWQMHLSFDIRHDVRLLWKIRYFG